MLLGPGVGALVLTATLVLLSSSRLTLAYQPPKSEVPLPKEVSENVEGSFERLLMSGSRILPATTAAAIVLAIFWGLATIVRFVVALLTRYVSDPTLKHLLMQLAYYGVWLIGIIVALDAVGVNSQSVVTGLGLTGVALGFALKDIVLNFVSGIMILAMRYFQIGDQIAVGDTEGTVERIDLRATHIRTFDGSLVLVPNGEIMTSRLTNNTASPLRRASVSVYLNYGQDVARALSIVLDTVNHVPGVASSPAPSIQLHELTPQHVRVEARFWTDSRRTDFMRTASAARLAIVRALATKGIELPVAATPSP
jgi:small-conductance mechanosensitive channel